MLLDRRDSCWIVIPDAHLGYYYERSVTVRLQEDILTPLKRDFPQSPRYAAGISLGGMGSLFMQRDIPGSFERVYLIAPYLGESPALLASLQAAPDLASWEPEPGLKAEDYEIEIWTLLAAHARGEADLGELWLMYGEDDRYSAWQDILANDLPPERVITMPGGHEWSTWVPLWQSALERSLPAQ